MVQRFFHQAYMRYIERSGFEPWPGHCVVFLGRIRYLDFAQRLKLTCFRKEILIGYQQILWVNLSTNLISVDWSVRGSFDACLLPLTSYCDSHQGVNIRAWQMPTFKDLDSNLKTKDFSVNKQYPHQNTTYIHNQQWFPSYQVIP